MKTLRCRINPATFVITQRQLAKYLKINLNRIWRWEKWAHVLWVHIEGLGGYFISYRKLEQWVAACSTLTIRLLSPAITVLSVFGGMKGREVGGTEISKSS